MRISSRLLINSVLIASFAVLVTTILIGGMSFNYGKQILEQQAEEKLVLVRDLKADSLARYFSSLKNQAIIFAKNLTIIEAMREFDAGFNKYASEVKSQGLDKYKQEIIEKYIQEFSRDYAADNNGLTFDAKPYLNISNESTFALQYNYIFNNPYGIDKESKLGTVEDGSTYSKVHAKFHDQLKDFKELFDFEDIFLVDPDTGDIVYTVAKGLDFTTSLTKGPFANTALGKVFRKANDEKLTAMAVVSDFEPYSPSNDDQAAFIAIPIFENEIKIGILIFQVNLSAINDIMTSSREWKEVGLGATGESYLIDHQRRMLSESRAYIEDPQAYIKQLQALGVEGVDIPRIQAKKSNIGWQKINDLAATEALSGKAGFAIFKDYRGVEVLGAYEPIKVAGVNWAIICKIDKAEAFAPVKALATKVVITLLGVMLLILFFAVIVGVGLARQISLPIEKLSAMIQILARTQDLTQRIHYAADDEIGDMAKAMNQLIESFQQTCQETLMSTQRVQLAANKLMALADEIDERETSHKYEDNFDFTHEKTEAIKDAGDSLSELSTRLQVLSRQFKVFEAESERTSGW